jgi:uncharacterized membrane protein HdeD (DUF308 family)
MLTPIALTQLLPLIIAQIDAEPQRVSLLKWAFMALGLFYTVIFLLVGIALFIGAVVVVIGAPRPSVVAAYFAFLPLPLLIGVWGACEGLIRTYSHIAMSPYAPKPSEMFGGISEALFIILAALLATTPAYGMTALGLFIRTLLYDDRRVQ